MPEISRFYGLVVYMYAKDHFPPHFHIKYGEDNAEVSIETGEIIAGNLPRRAIRLAQDWVELHQIELYQNWSESQKENPNFLKIIPLK